MAPYVKFEGSRKSKKQSERYRHYQSFNIDSEWAVDVGLMPKTVGGYIGFLCVVNVCTRFLSAEPMISRNKREFIRVFDLIMQKTNITPKTIYSDKEPALNSNEFKCFANERGVRIIFTKSLFKVGIAERAIEYIKQSLKKLVEGHNNEDWTKYIYGVVTQKNNTYNKALLGVPSKVNKYNVWYYNEKKADAETPKALRGRRIEVDWHKKFLAEQKVQKSVAKQTHKSLIAKDGYLFKGEPVFINLSSVQLLHDSRDTTFKKSKTG